MWKLPFGPSPWKKRDLAIVNDEKQQKVVQNRLLQLNFIPISFSFDYSSSQMEHRRFNKSRFMAKERVLVLEKVWRLHKRHAIWKDRGKILWEKAPACGIRHGPVHLLLFTHSTEQVDLIILSVLSMIKERQKSSSVHGKKKFGFCRWFFSFFLELLNNNNKNSLKTSNNRREKGNH